MRTLRIRPHLVALPLTQVANTTDASWQCLLCHTIQASTTPQDAALAHLRDTHACTPVTPATAL